MTSNNTTEDTLIPVIFNWPYDAKATVSIAGTFNQWTPQAMVPQKDRRFEIRLFLNPKTKCEFKFVVDQQWFWDVRLPTTRDSFGNTNNILDLQKLLKDDLIFKEDVKNAGYGTRWVVRASDGGRFKRCPDEVSENLDKACLNGNVNERFRIGPHLDAHIRWRYLGGELCVDFSQIDMTTGAVSIIKPIGAFPLKLLKPFHHCEYGLDSMDDDLDDELPTFASEQRKLQQQKLLIQQFQSQSQSQKKVITICDIPDEVLILIMQKMLRTCKCQCHYGQVYAEETVHALCTLELVCKRFKQPTKDISLPEQAARSLCKYLTNTNQIELKKRCWKEELLWLDPKTLEREEKLKKQLYLIAYRKKSDGKFMNDEVVRGATIAEIKRKWKVWDVALAHSFVDQKTT